MSKPGQSATAPPPMEAEEVRQCFDDIGWSIIAGAAMLGINRTTVQDWHSGRRQTPAPLAAYLRKAAAWYRANPPPENIRRATAEAADCGIMYQPPPGRNGPVRPSESL